MIAVGAAVEIEAAGQEWRIDDKSHAAFADPRIAIVVVDLEVVRVGRRDRQRRAGLVRRDGDACGRETTLALAAIARSLAGIGWITDRLHRGVPRTGSLKTDVLGCRVWNAARPPDIDKRPPRLSVEREGRTQAVTVRILRDGCGDVNAPSRIGS